MKVSYKSVFSLLILTVVAALAYWLYISSQAPQIYVPDVQTNSVVVASTAYYYVSIVDDIVYEDTDTTLTLEEAMTHCETVAYNTDHMWKQIICVYDGTEIYNDIFVAG